MSDRGKIEAAPLRREWTDPYGRAVDVDDDGQTVKYTRGGVTVEFPSGQDDAAKAVLTSLVPEGVDIPAPAPVTPRRVTAFQIRTAMLEAGHRGTPAFALDPRSAMAWLTCADANRGGRMVAGIMSHFGLDDTAMDALFIAAAGIES